MNGVLKSLGCSSPLDGSDLNQSQIQKLLSLALGQRPIRVKIGDLCKDGQLVDDAKVFLEKGYLVRVENDYVEIPESVNMAALVEKITKPYNDIRIKQMYTGSF